MNFDKKYKVMITSQETHMIEPIKKMIDLAGGDGIPIFANQASEVRADVQKALGDKNLPDCILIDRTTVDDVLPLVRNMAETRRPKLIYMNNPLEEPPSDALINGLIRLPFLRADLVDAVNATMTQSKGIRAL